MPEELFNLQAIARQTLLRYGFLVEPPRPRRRRRRTSPNRISANRPSRICPAGSGLPSTTTIPRSGQIEYLEPAGNESRLYIAIADVSGWCPGLGSGSSGRAQYHLSLHRPAHVPLFPEKLSCDLTSLVENQKRLAVVTEMRLGSDGQVRNSSIYRPSCRIAPADVYGRGRLA